MPDQAASANLTPIPTVADPKQISPKWRAHCQVFTNSKDRWGT